MSVHLSWSGGPLDTAPAVSRDPGEQADDGCTVMKHCVESLEYVVLRKANLATFWLTGVTHSPNSLCGGPYSGTSSTIKGFTGLRRLMSVLNI
jgi:hypothetical protein